MVSAHRLATPSLGARGLSLRCVVGITSPCFSGEVMAGYDEAISREEVSEFAVWQGCSVEFRNKTAALRR